MDRPEQPQDAELLAQLKRQNELVRERLQEAPERDQALRQRLRAARLPLRDRALRQWRKSLTVDDRQQRYIRDYAQGVGKLLGIHISDEKLLLALVELLREDGAVQERVAFLLAERF
ncbi:MAG: hypothetical protein HY335_11020 [Deinococcus sp.]|nr:hypothetical protein [Deinococcus sp.]